MKGDNDLNLTENDRKILSEAIALVDDFWHSVDANNIDFPHPPTDDAAAFCVTEVAEVLDALIRTERPWYNRSSKDSSRADIRAELCDVIFMAICAVNFTGPSYIDLALEELSWERTQEGIYCHAYLLVEYAAVAMSQAVMVDLEESSVAALQTALIAIVMLRDRTDISPVTALKGMLGQRLAKLGVARPMLS